MNGPLKIAYNRKVSESGMKRKLLLLCASFSIALFATPSLRAAEGTTESTNETVVSLMQKTLVAYQAGQPLEAVRYLGEARSVAREQKDRPGEALVLFSYGGLYEKMGLEKQAQESQDKARGLLKEINDPGVTAVVLSSMGVAYKITGQPKRAAQLLEEAITISQAAGDKSTEGFALVNLGWLEKDGGQLQKAWQHLPRGAALLHEAGDWLGEAWAQQGLAWLHNDLGEKEQGRALMQQSLELARRPRQSKAAATILDSVREAVFDPQLLQAKALFGLASVRGGRTPEDRQAQIAYLEEALPLARAFMMGKC